jgi:hypothetical protein
MRAITAERFAFEKTSATGPEKHGFTLPQAV